ncbi:DNA polymerase III subunit chi [Pseudoalteromonas sp. T1lg65]|uniref:DNA polymerase III subunit chi n=1 Tax=Pseudoalteromonas sp. T1lg65 TaxID=2077101 RepID=UPI003F79FDB1
MTIKARFYVLKHNDEPAANIPAHFDLAAQTAASLYREGHRIFIYVDNIQDAQLIDEHLWCFDAERFVPHNLQGEGPKGGAPVEIGEMPPVARRPILINLAKVIPDFIRRFEQVYDFVPVEASAKQAARERFKQLRNIGATISTEDFEN